MRETRRLQGIVALSAGALASVALTSPTTAVDSPNDDRSVAARGESVRALRQERGPRTLDSFERAFITWEYATGTDPTADASIMREAAEVDPASGAALIKWQYDALDLVEGALLGPHDRRFPELRS